MLRVLRWLWLFFAPWQDAPPAAQAPVPDTTRARKALDIGPCPHCGRQGTYLRQDGEPNARYHSCGPVAETAPPAEPVA